MKKNINLDINYINPFLIGASMVFNTLLKIDLKKGKTKIASECNPINDVIITIEISGKIHGYVIYSFSFYTVIKIAQVVMPGLSEDQVRAEYKDIMGEIANMITGNAISVLSKSGLEISTPRVMHKDDLSIQNHGKLTTLVLKQYSKYGQLETTIILNKS